MAARRSAHDLQHAAAPAAQRPAHRTVHTDGRRGHARLAGHGVSARGGGERVAAPEERIRALEAQVEELKGRVSGLIFLLCAAVVTLAIVLLFV